MSEHVAPHYGKYVKIWAILLALLFVSIIGPELGIKFVTLVTAFGIAIVKAWMVGAYFMHLNIEKKYIAYALLVMVAILTLLFFGTAADTMHDQGLRWVKDPIDT